MNSWLESLSPEDTNTLAIIAWFAIFGGAVALEWGWRKVFGRRS